MTYIGNRVINSDKIRGDEDYDNAADEVHDYLAQFAREQGMGDFVKDFDERWLDRTNKLDDYCHQYIDEYQVVSMFDELAEWLSYRDFESSYGRVPDFRNNEDDHEKFYVIRNFWDSEFEKNWLQWLNVIRK